MSTIRLSIFGLIIFLHCTMVMAQTPEWARSGGGPGEEYAKSVAVDDLGNVYTTGIFQQTADFDPVGGGFNLTAVGSYDAFVQKRDANGDFQWALALGGAGEDRATSIAADTDGSVLVTGWFSGTVDFDPGAGQFFLTSMGDFDAFMCKLTSDGGLVWAKSLGGTAGDKGQKILVGDTGDLWLLGEFQNTVDFDPSDTLDVNLVSAGGLDIFVCRFDTDGHLIWAKNIGGLNYDSAFGGALDAQENVIVTGYFQDTADFDPSGLGTYTMTSSGSTDVFVVKLDLAGEFVWAGQIGGSSLDLCESVTTDLDGNVYLAGHFQATCDFDPGAGQFNLTSEGGDDAYLCKWYADGQFQWAVSFGAPDAQSAQGVKIDSDGNVVVLGIFQNTVDFDPGPDTAEISSAGNYDTFLVQFDSNGNFQWSQSFQGAAMVLGLSLNADQDGNLYASGSFSGSAEIVTQMGAASFVSSGSFDFWVVKLSVFVPECNTVAYTEESVCDSFTAPSGAIFSTSGIYQDIIPNMAGCDSLITIDLTILESTFFTLNETVCSLYELNGIEYFATGVYEQIIPNAAGCDSTITLQLTVDPSLTVGHLALTALASGNPVTGIATELFAVLPEGPMTSWSTTTNATGMATFSNIPFGDYVCRAQPNPALKGQGNLLTTYTNEQFSWTAANIISLGCGDTEAEIIEMIELTPFTGPGTASGTVLYATTQSGMPMESVNRSFVTGDPLPNVPCIIGLDSAGTDSFVPIGLTFTTTQGIYSFENLPPAFMSIYLDIPGIPMVESHYFTVTNEVFEFTDLNFYVDSMSGIYTDDIIQILETSKTTDDILVFPNPFSGQLNIQSNLSSAHTLTGTIRTLDGCTADAFRTSSPLSVFDLSHLAPGVYVLEVFGANSRSISRIVKQ